LFVRVKLFATLAKFTPGAEPGIPFIAEVPEGSSLTDLIMRLELPEKEVNLTFVNGRVEGRDYRLKSDDDIGFFPLIGGG
jgi:molybdopterin synthase sulfur carrier subunit